MTRFSFHLHLVGVLNGIKHTILGLMISWTSFIPAESNPFGSDFRLPKVGKMGDGILLRNHVSRILKEHFRGNLTMWILWTCSMRYKAWEKPRTWGTGRW